MAEEHSTEAERRLIVVGVDGSESSMAALAWAADYAELSGLSLEAVTVWAFPMTWGWSPPWPPEFDPETDARRILEHTITKVLGDEPHVAISRLVTEGHPAPVLVEKSKSAKLVVVGSRGHGEFAGMLLGSVSEFLVAHSHCPVVVIR